MILMSVLSIGSACADAPTAFPPSGTAPDASPAANLGGGAGCGAAIQQFQLLYGYPPPGGVTCHASGDGWAIYITFYWDDTYSAWYVWLSSNDYEISQSCGDPVLDGIMQSYHDSYYYTGAEFPECHEFNQATRTVYFTHADLSQGNGTTWAWLKTALVIAPGNGYGADEWRTQYGGPRNASSGYRTPVHNHELSGSARDSRHMHGDALDLRNDSGTQAEWDAMVNAAQLAHADYIEPLTQSGLAHVHADWRNH
jgi:hypothetical protein